MGSSESKESSDPSQLLNNIPVIPGWDGIPISTKSVNVKILIKPGFLGAYTSFEPFKEVILTEAKGGLKLAGAFMPKSRDKQTKGFPADGELVSVFKDDYKANVKLIFQTDRYFKSAPQEVTFLQTAMKHSHAGFSEAETVSGYEDLYTQLNRIGLQGYQLSCVIDEPNRRTTGLNSKESNVHLVCQKAEGHKQAEEIHYQIANCVIEMKYHINSISAAMDNLKPLLSNYLTRGYRLGSVYNTDSTTKTGFSTYESQCQFILEKTAVNYYFVVVDLNFIWKQGWYGRSMDHHQYEDIITGYAIKGWELAAIIEMPDYVSQGSSMYAISVKLIFQAPAAVGAPGGNLGNP